MKNNFIINSPVKGTLITLEKIGDGVFSEKMLGDGVAVVPCDTHLYAPISGKIVTLFPTGHAIGIRSDEGVEILVHIGIDTVEITEKVFHVFLEQGQTVKQGDLMATADFERIKSLGYQCEVIIIETSKAFRVLQQNIDNMVDIDQYILKIEKE